MDSVPLVEARTRGRPRADVATDVPDRLIRALREALGEKSHHELTLKEIAARADTSQEMIRYYFGSKDGLITAMMLQSSKRIEETLSDLKARLRARPQGATLQIVTTLVRLYMAEMPSTRVSQLEYQKEHSAIKDGYLTARSNIIIGALHDIFVSLIERGVYRQDCDARHLALSMMVVAGHPVQLLRALPSEWLTAEMLESDPWIEHVTALFESQCAPPRRPAAVGLRAAGGRG
jgi:AcrR family transcriptional regulator